jgi:hypothetical protein
MKIKIVGINNRYFLFLKIFIQIIFKNKIFLSVIYCFKPPKRFSKWKFSWWFKNHIKLLILKRRIKMAKKENQIPCGKCRNWDGCLITPNGNRKCEFSRELISDALTLKPDCTMATRKKEK